ncbi:hypothetical protein L1049_027127 [Liquidambar formosana]|uniref:ATP synthase F1 complex delta/epsilon subunit N-terminal domain-containing protein n=1 Tax=Liquidambar formosana TaxID=63359 RepID=A0AAP0N5D5_LIQFO
MWRASRILGRPVKSYIPPIPIPDPAFVEAWKKVEPEMQPPRVLSSYMKPRPTPPTSIPSKITLNFVLPYASELSNKEVDMVIIPATNGQMGVLPRHVPTIAQLRPGVLSVHQGNGVKKYFLSSGFAFIHANPIADIVAVEAVPIDRIDPSAVRKGLEEFTRKLSKASTDVERDESPNWGRCSHCSYHCSHRLTLEDFIPPPVSSHFASLLFCFSEYIHRKSNYNVKPRDKPQDSRENDRNNTLSGNQNRIISIP